MFGAVASTTAPPSPSTANTIHRAASENRRGRAAATIATTIAPALIAP